ncbi:serine/threonine-protein kinase PknG [Actinoplanes octamycinicus]|uniref:non-specific serine/threonine protein kinase n=1 Tax=Actinoplanes octamycinicus TaxID=135948 RepID=A0A7W7MBT2_9ACTN|nr:serine/threonine-protein kinase [Actinoplanes octamycinicus]MBB4744439.1 serine/threonine-protein kinase PknG [Actinoplanes octamycinicus]GIE61643.1 serine/threonine-protein kinase PknG [Actinoplanes octamycinicus]
MKCQRNCPGTIEDGYCDTCGMAPAAASQAAPAAPVPAAPPAPAAPGRCQRDGCGGTIEDGYCDTCGLAPVQKATPAVPKPRSATSNTGTQSSTRSSALSTRTGGSRRGSGRTGSTRRFGSGLVEIAPIAKVDPASTIMVDAQVPESKRYCAKCTNAVGRSRGDRPGRTSGFCPHCGEAFNFTPKLVKGDVVGGQYEVAGALAHGGLGWVYLAVDLNVSKRWVVLKGLLNSQDEDALAAALAEQRFLAEVEHPNIVKIYNFVEHDGAGYIVMEYVGGKSLKDMLKQRREANGGNSDPLPLDQALEFLIEIMPAFSYLHERGLIFCDFKPDNVIQSGDQMKLIDLGGVVHIDDEEAAIYGTVGYQAPEMATDGPSVASDLYTIGRSLAVLTTDFRGYQTTFKESLPSRNEFEVYTRHESFYRLIDRATRPRPDERFVDAAEMQEQMLGVLRQVVAAQGSPKPAPSKVFTGELRTDLKAGAPRWQDLPTPLIDLADPAAGFLASITLTDPSEVLALLKHAPQETVEVRLRALRAEIDLGTRHGFFDDARQARDRFAARDGADWRLAWYDGLLALATQDWTTARARFDAVYSVLPGELAPQLALGFTEELAGRPQVAAGYYDVVSRTDPAYTTAAAGLARCRLAGGDRTGAVEAYQRVPGTSSAYASSQVGAVRALVHAHPGATVDVQALTDAAALIERLEVERAQLAELRAELLKQALSSMRGGVKVPAAVLGGGRTGDTGEKDVRFALEDAYREMARAAHGPEKIRLVDMANAARPRTRT